MSAVVCKIVSVPTMAPTYSGLSMTSGAFPFLLSRAVAGVGGFAGAPAGVAFCLLDRRPEDPVCEVELGEVLGSLLGAAFRFLDDGVEATVLGASAEAAPFDATATDAVGREERAAWLAA